MKPVRIVEAVTVSQVGDEGLVCFEFFDGVCLWHQEDALRREVTCIDEAFHFVEVDGVANDEFKIRFSCRGQSRDDRLLETTFLWNI